MNKINEVGYYYHDNIRNVTRMRTSRTFLSPEGDSEEVPSFISSNSNLSMLASHPVLTIESHLTALQAVRSVEAGLELKASPLLFSDLIERGWLL